MFAFIQGTLAQISPLHVVLEAHGIGYKIFIPLNAYGKLPAQNTPFLLHTSLVIREFSQALYGFFTAQERDLFEALMNVSGIGPKLALSIIGHIEGHDLQRAIHHKDISTLSKIPGIGKKTAERLIIELRDKLPALLPPNPSDLAVHIQADPKTQTISDAMSALIHLGYNQITAQKAIKKTLKDLSEETDLATLITAALNHV